MLEVVAKDGRVEGQDLVEEENVKVVVQKMVMVMSRCDWGGLSSMVARVATLALLPC